MAVMAATAIRAAIRPYSMAVAPFLSLISLRMNHFRSPWFHFWKSTLPAARAWLLGQLQSLLWEGSFQTFNGRLRLGVDHRVGDTLFHMFDGDARDDG